MVEFFKIFFVILLDEIGDKSELATLGFASIHNKWVVFIASAGALIITSLIASFFGDFLQTKINARYLGISSGILFIVIGILTLWRVFKLSN